MTWEDFFYLNGSIIFCIDLNNGMVKFIKVCVCV